MDDQALLSAIGKRLRELRDARNLTQADVAARCRTTPQMISNIERCRNWMSIPQLFALAKGLEVPIAYFFQDVETPLGRGELHNLIDTMAPYERAAAEQIIKAALGMRGGPPS